MTATVVGAPPSATPTCTEDKDCWNRNDGWSCQDEEFLGVHNQPFCVPDVGCLCLLPTLACDAPDGDTMSCNNYDLCPKGQSGVCHNKWCACQANPTDHCTTKGSHEECSQIFCQDGYISACGAGSDPHKCACTPVADEKCTIDDVLLYAETIACIDSKLSCGQDQLPTCNRHSNICECAPTEFPTCVSDDFCAKYMDCSGNSSASARCTNNECGCQYDGSTACEFEIECSTFICPPDGSLPTCDSLMCVCVNQTDTSWDTTIDNFCTHNGECEYYQWYTNCPGGNTIQCQNGECVCLPPPTLNMGTKSGVNGSSVGGSVEGNKHLNTSSSFQANTMTTMLRF